MTIFTDIPKRRSTLDEFQAPLSDVLGAVAREALVYSPTSSIDRYRELRAAEEGRPRGFLGLGGRAEPETSLLRPEDARQRVQDSGVDLAIPEEGIRGGALDILIERKREEMQRQDVIARGPGGVLAGFARFGAGFGASMLDPLNVISAFIPVVGPAKYASMLKAAGGTMGRAAVRARVGAVEGTVGAALVEPIIYAAATQEQADYDLTDSLLNIGFGTVFGGGLHVGAGAVGDAVAKGLTWRQARPAAGEAVPKMLDDLDMPTREAALRTGVAQALNGKNIDIQHLLPEGSTGSPRAEGLPQLQGSPIAGGGEVPSAPRIGDAPTASRETVQQGFLSEAKSLAASRGLPDDFIEDVYHVGSRATGKNRPDSDFDFVVKIADHVNLSDRANNDAWEALIKHFDQVKSVDIDGKTYNADVLVSDELNYQVEQRAIASAPGRGRGARPDPRRLQQAAARTNAPESVRLADPEAVRSADETLQGADPTRQAETEETPDLGVAEAEEDALRVATALGAPELVARELAPFDELADTAAAYGRAVEAAALCQIRRGA